MARALRRPYSSTIFHVNSDDGPAESPWCRAATSPPCRPARKPRSALVPAVLNRCPLHGGPMVRIHLPPARSQATSGVVSSGACPPDCRNFTARVGLNGLRGRLDRITLVATPVMIGWGNSSTRAESGVLMRNHRLDLTDNERAILITALRRLVDPQPLSPQIQALKAILERLEPQKPQPIPDTASTG